MSEEERTEHAVEMDRTATIGVAGEGTDQAAGEVDLRHAEIESGAGKRSHHNGSKTESQATEGNAAEMKRLRHISHEIRTPITSITGLANLLLESDLDTQQQTSLETIRDSGEYVLSLVNDVLELLHTSSDDVTLEAERVDLEPVIEASMDMLAHAAREKGIELTYTVNQDVPPVIYTDGTHLKQVLVNLLSNAVNSTEEGGVTLHVEQAGSGWAPQAERRLLAFEVQDTGAGIPQEHQETLFQPFAQQTLSNGSVGTGLGLAISKQLVTLMGGSIDVESTPRQGSTFRFTIQAGDALAQSPA